MNRSFRKCILTWMVTILLVIGSIAEPVLADPLPPAPDHEHNDYTLAAHQDATCTEGGFNHFQQEFPHLLGGG